MVSNLKDYQCQLLNLFALKAPCLNIILFKQLVPWGVYPMPNTASIGQANTSMNAVPCPECGATKRVRGRLYKRGSLADIRFEPDETPEMSLKDQAVSWFSFKKRLHVTPVITPDL
jgi:hypothetical protein